MRNNYRCSWHYYHMLIMVRTKQIDSTAIFILDRMADVIGDLESVCFDSNTVKIN
jgi:hypothetical protein